MAPPPGGPGGWGLGLSVEVRLPEGCYAGWREAGNGRVVTFDCVDPGSHSLLLGALAEASGAREEARLLRRQLEECGRRVEQLEAELERLRRGERVAIDRVRERVLELARRLELEVERLEGLDDLVSAVEGLWRRLGEIEERLREAERRAREADLVDALLVAYRLPHEESGRLGAKTVVERGPEGLVIRKVVTLPQHLLARLRTLRKHLPRELLACARLDTGVYLCPPTARQALERVRREAEAVVRALREAGYDVDWWMSVEPVRLSRTAVLEYIRRDLEQARKELAEAEARAEQLRRERRRYDHQVAKAKVLRERIRLLQEWMRALTEDTEGTLEV